MVRPKPRKNRKTPKDPGPQPPEDLPALLAKLAALEAQEDDRVAGAECNGTITLADLLEDMDLGAGPRGDL